MPKDKPTKHETRAMAKKYGVTPEALPRALRESERGRQARANLAEGLRGLREDRR